MAASSAFKPKASLTEAPTNLKEAIDWVLRVTGKDGKALSGDECICGLAAAVTDLLQSVELEYHGYEGDVKNGADSTGKNKGATQKEVTNHLNGLFSLVQGLGGTAVVRTYIDQLAQVLSALVGWSSITMCNGGGSGCDHGKNGSDSCKYLEDKTPENKCDSCGCMKWDVPRAGEHDKGHHLGRRCTKCKDSGNRDQCKCTPGGCKGQDACECAKAGKCCKCYCKEECKDKCKRECRCTKDIFARNEYNKESYMSAYPSEIVYTRDSFVESKQVDAKTYWKDLTDYTPGDTKHDTSASQHRHQCAKILLGSVCLIWSGITYLYWTGKYAESSPRWNNHILDGSGLDDGTLSQWLQALGFPKEMLNNSAPGNRLDAVIWDGFKEKFYLGFPDTSGSNGSGAIHGKDKEGNTFRDPSSMNFAGYIHTLEKGAFGDSVFPNGTTSGTSGSVPDRNKLGPLYKIYILSCAYFTGLQKKNAALSNTPTAANTPKTIREILYWLSALPYSPAYKGLLEHCNSALEKASPTEKKLSFLQENRWAPITVHEYNLFAHFQAVTQYCPLVLIGIQGGLKGTDSTPSHKEPAIHSLYANTECHFTYPTVDIQAYNQVVHYIRGLFYQLYFLRKQCAVKVTCGGKWRECRYGDGVVSKGVISWMCLGCSPMEHDRKSRVKEMKKTLGGVVKLIKEKGKADNQAERIENAKILVGAIGDVVVQLGNAQEVLEGKNKEAIDGVKRALSAAKAELETEVQKVMGGLTGKLKEAKATVEKLTKGGSGDLLGEVEKKLGNAKSNDFDQGKNKISEAINEVRKALEALKEGVIEMKNKEVEGAKEVLGEEITGVSLTEIVDVYEKHFDIMQKLQNVTNDLLSLCNSPKCPGCNSHSTKCGQQPTPTVCPACLQPTTTGVPSPLQAFLEDRLPGFSCSEVPDTDQPDYPLAASHLGHCGGSGQCCPLPMGFRGNFYNGGISDMTGQRLYGILCFFSNENMMQSCVYTLVRVTAALSATTPQVLGDVFGFFRGGVGEKERGKNKNRQDKNCNHTGDPSQKKDEQYFCGWCASGLRDEVKKIEWIPKDDNDGGKYRKSVGDALIKIKGSDSTSSGGKQPASPSTPSNLSTLTTPYLSPLTGELYTAVSATFGGTYLSWVLYLSDALEGGLKSLSDAFQQIECRGCKGCDPNKCKKGEHGQRSDAGSALCQCQSIVSCTGVLPVLYRHGFSYGNPFNLEGYHQKNEKEGDYSIDNKGGKKHCHEFLDSLQDVIKKKQDASQSQDTTHPLTELLKQVGQLQYDIRLPWIFVLTIAWLVAVLYLAFGAIWPLDWTHMRSHWLRGGEHQWQCMWYKVMTGRKGMELIEYFGRR